MVNQLSLFSGNEAVEELPTSDLRWGGINPIIRSPSIVVTNTYVHAHCVNRYSYDRFSKPVTSSLMEATSLIINAMHCWSAPKGNHYRQFSLHKTVPDLCVLVKWLNISLRYLFLPALLGDLSLQHNDGDRLECLSRARVYFVDYLQRCKTYSITQQVLGKMPFISFPCILRVYYCVLCTVQQSIFLRYLRKIAWEKLLTRNMYNYRKLDFVGIKGTVLHVCFLYSWLVYCKNVSV